MAALTGLLALVALLTLGILAAPAGAAAPDRAAALPVTGRSIPLLAAGVAVGVALLLRVGRSRLGDRDPDQPDDPDVE